MLVHVVCMLYTMLFNMAKRKVTGVLKNIGVRWAKFSTKAPQGEHTLKSFPFQQKQIFLFLLYSMHWKRNSSKESWIRSTKILELLDLWFLPKSKQPERGKQGENKSYETHLSHKNDPIIPVKLRFFEEIAFNLN